MVYVSFADEDDVPAQSAQPSRKRHRHRRPLDRQLLPPAEEHPLADPTRPIPNIICADKFEYYYQSQNLVASHSEWRFFISTLHKALPITFRVSTAASLAQVAAECLSEGAPLLRGTGAVPPAVELPWCASWMVGVKAGDLKMGVLPELRTFNEWLTKYASLGVLTRQAIESMVPVALLRVEQHHAVLD
eukprot:350038-Prymnesium_polylepis.1